MMKEPKIVETNLDFTIVLPRKSTKVIRHWGGQALGITSWYAKMEALKGADLNGRWAHTQKGAIGIQSASMSAVTLRMPIPQRNRLKAHHI